MTRQPLAAASSIALLVSGCAIHQTVNPVTRFEQRQVCIIENAAVRSTFLDSYSKSLVAKGYAVRQLPATASIADCAVTSTYTANWRWDPAMYMAYAEIKVYVDGEPAGDAHYDSLRGGANMGKFIGADKKINELVDQLFPAGAGL